MQIANVSAARADTHAWESVQTGKLLLIGQRPVVVQTGVTTPHALRLRQPQRQVNNFGHITLCLWYRHATFFPFFCKYPATYAFHLCVEYETQSESL